MLGRYHRWRAKRLTKRAEALLGQAVRHVAAAPKEPDPHETDKLVRTAALCVAAELLMRAEIPDQRIVAALSAGTGLETPTIDALLGACSADPIPRLRAALLEDIAVNTELAGESYVVQAGWCLVTTWRETSPDMEFGHAEVDAMAFARTVDGAGAGGLQT
jgi:hypothetical protein